MNYITRHTEGIAIHDGSSHILNTTLNKYLDDMARTFLSTLVGRKQAAKTILNVQYLLPVFIDETVLLFPTHAHRHMDNHYINYHQVLSIQKHHTGSLVVFQDGSMLHVKKSKNTLQKQVQKARQLWDYYECAKQKESVYIQSFH